MIFCGWFSSELVAVKRFSTRKRARSEHRERSSRDKRRGMSAWFDKSRRRDSARNIPKNGVRPFDAKPRVHVT